MRAYVASRLAQTALVVFLSLSAVFAMVRLSGDPVLLFMPMDIQAKDVNEFRQRLGFNDPLPGQYGRFLAGAVRGDFGESLRYKQDALGLVLERLPATLLLAGASLLLTVGVALPLGVLSAVRRNSLLDHVGTVATVLGQATPGFWLGLMLIFVFSVKLRWLPTGGTGSLPHLAPPPVALAAFFAAPLARLPRSAAPHAPGEGHLPPPPAEGAREGARRPARGGLHPAPRAPGHARPPPRHRPARPRPPRARPLRRAARALHRRVHGPHLRRGRGLPRSRRGVRRALALHRAHADRRRPALVPVHPARDDDQRHRRPRPPEHHPEPVRGGVGRLRARRPRRGALRQAARLRAGGGGPRDGPRAAALPPRAAQRRAVDHRRREPPVLLVHRRRGRDQLPRLRHPAADARVGGHAVREPRLPLPRLVARRVSGRGARPHGARRQPARRLAPRHARSEAPRLSGPPPSSLRTPGPPR